MRDTQIDPDTLLSLPFDHYQRYSLTRRIIDYLWPDEARPPLRILDVGGQNSSLKYFLPDDEIISADPLPPLAFAHTDKLPFKDDGYVVASGAALPFADRSFDVVCAHDTLEHVPEELRGDFLAEMARVARGLAILNGPVYTPRTAELEKRIALFSERALDWENEYLKEHIEQGLPAADSIRKSLDSAGLTTVSVPNGSLVMWLTMMALRHYLIALP
ncbi:MAG: class I SAM-dependent methyltransferase, partial [Chloroflexota bacterium]